MTQQAKMELLAADEDGTEGTLLCDCGEKFDYSIFTEENIEIDDNHAQRVKCPGCGCYAAPKTPESKENPLDEETRKSIGARTRERLEATKRLLRRQ